MRTILCISLGLSFYILSSCLAIYEKYTLNHDGSDSMESVISVAFPGKIKDGTSQATEDKLNGRPVTVSTNVNQILVNREILKTKIKPT